MDTHTILIAFGLTVLAGLSTGIGSGLAFFTKRTNTKFLSVALGFSAGVMIYVAFTELLSEAKVFLIGQYGVATGSWLTVASFFGGILVIGLIDKVVPSFENPHEIHRVEELYGEEAAKCKKLYRLGIFSAIALTIHNFPEGIATFATYLADPVLGVSIAIAVALHNIPEGIAVSVPIYYATCDRKKAFLYSAMSGLGEPLGAVIGFILLSQVFNGAVFGFLFAFVAGIMVFISLDQLLPAARQYGEGHLAVYGLVSGMVVMALSLLLLL